MFDVIVALVAILGQICHIVKKRQEEGVSEIGVFRKWVINRPFNTIVAAVAAVVAAHAVQITNGDIIASVAQAFIAGFAADSAINRAGNNA